MKPSDIYALPNIAHKFASRDVCGYLLNSWHQHIPEIDSYDFGKLPEDSPLEIKIHVDPFIDGYRVLTIGSLWWHGNPVMIFRHAGRSGHDAYDRFITDEAAYMDVVQYLRTFVKNDLSNVIALNENNLDLDSFFGYDMVELFPDCKG